MIGYPKWFTKKIIHTIFFISAITGALLFPTLLVLNLEWDFPWRLPTEARDWVVIAHVIFGFIVFTVLGALSSIHIRLGLRKKSKVNSGLTVVALIILLGLSGIGILYSAEEELTTKIGIVHFILGSTLALAYVIHLFTKPTPKKT